MKRLIAISGTLSVISVGAFAESARCNVIYVGRNVGEWLAL